MSSQVIKKIIYPIAKENIFPCGRYFCVCVEYLNFGKKIDVERYKQCMVTNLKEDYHIYKYKTSYNRMSIR